MKNQLRLGSLVGVRVENKLLTAEVTAITASDICVRIVDNPFDDLSDDLCVEYWEPLPMSVKWLVKFGFTERVIQHPDWCKESYYYKEIPLGGFIEFADDYSAGLHPDNPELDHNFFATTTYPYVHQFQNLIHALTNNYDA